MIITVVTPPSAIVSIDEAKAHLRQRSGHEDALITSLIAAATATIDGPAGWLGRALGRQTIELATDEFCDVIPLPCLPVIEIESVNYLDQDAVSQTVDAAVYGLNGRTIFRRWHQSWPSSLYRDPAAVRIRYVAGYDPADVPAPIKQAILLIVGHWFQNREAVVVGTISGDLPLGVEALLSPYRVWS